MRIDTKHQAVGKLITNLNSPLTTEEWGSLYPVLGSDLLTIVGVFDSYDGSPEGYELSEQLQAFIPVK